MKQILAIAVGGSLGALLRYGVANGVHAVLGRGFPYGTLVVNVSGCLAMGVLYVLLVERLALSPEWRAALLIGVLGAFTTFSSFSMETFALFEEGERMKALMNVVLSVSLCLAAVWLGVLAGRRL
ncbi:MAG: fluoride efflux transporter CrcB [Pseudomonadota bacterium]